MASADAEAAAYRPEGAPSADEIETARQLAEELGYRLVPMSVGEKLAAPSAHPDTVAEHVRRLAWLKAAKSAAEAQAKAYDAEYEELRQQAADVMVDDGVKKVTVDGWTAYFHPVAKMSKVSEEVTTEDIKAALIEAGQASLIKSSYSYQSTQAWMKELISNGLPVPESVAKVLRLETDREVRLRRAPGS